MAKKIIYDATPAEYKPSAAGAALRGFGQGLFLEGYDEAQGVAGAALSPLNAASQYAESRDFARTADKAAAQEYPYIYNAAKAVGGVIPAAVGAVVTAPAKATAAAMPAINTAMGRILSAAKAAVPWGAATGLMASEGDAIDQIASTVGGGLLSGVTAGAFQGGAEGLRALRNSGIEKQAQGLFTRAMADDATPDELLATAQSYRSIGKGDVGVVADLGGAKTKDAITALGQSQGKAYSIMDKKFAPRNIGQQTRISQDIDDAFGQSGNFYKNLADQQAAARSAAKANYDAAYRAQVDFDDPVINELMKKVPDEAFLSAQKIANIRGYGQPVAATAKGANAAINSEGMDYVLRGLKDIESAAFRGGASNVGTATKDLRTQLQQRVFEINPALAQARKQYAGDMEALELAEAGKAFMRKSPNELAYEVSQISNEMLPFYQRGARESLLSNISRVSDSADTARKLSAIPAARENIAAVLRNPQAANRLAGQMGAESAMFQTASALKRGEQTGLGVGRLTAVEGTPFSNINRGGILERALNAITSNPQKAQAINERAAQMLTTGINSAEFNPLVQSYEKNIRDLMRQAMRAKMTGRITGAQVGAIPSNLLEVR